MLDAFVHVARDTFPEWPEKTVMKTVSAEEAEQNRQMWTALEDGLCALSALERVELVLYERPEHNEILTEEANAQLHRKTKLTPLSRVGFDRTRKIGPDKESSYQYLIS